MKRMTHRDFENYDTLKQDIIVAIAFMVISMFTMLYFSNQADIYVRKELAKPINYEEVGE